MKQAKWVSIVFDEKIRLLTRISSHPYDPKVWPETRKAYTDFIEEIDKVTEVYEMENKKK